MLSESRLQARYGFLQRGAMIVAADASSLAMSSVILSSRIFADHSPWRTGAFRDGMAHLPVDVAASFRFMGMETPRA
jgi:hypothetical protein